MSAADIKIRHVWHSSRASHSNGTLEVEGRAQPARSTRPFRPSIVIPTKNRCGILSQLLESIARLDKIDPIRPEIIVADNDSRDGTDRAVKAAAQSFPTTIRLLKVLRRGKSAAINDAVRVATGNVFAVLDDDVIVDKSWLTAVEKFFRDGSYQVGQGRVGLQSPAREDPEVQKLLQRYRTIPRIEYDRSLTEVHSLNGSNFFADRSVVKLVGGLDERLGPGASGTSEDIEFAQRLARSHIAIGYASEAVVYHRVDESRLTDEYFKQWHWQQGKSRLLIRDRSSVEIRLDLARAWAQYVYYTLKGEDRKRYRSKGRIYHYRGMIDAKREPVARRH
jgi:glycosyltransferase involved in cell wall biosynthesis